MFKYYFDVWLKMFVKTSFSRLLLSERFVVFDRNRLSEEGH